MGMQESMGKCRRVQASTGNCENHLFISQGESRCISVQRLGVHLVTVVLQPDDDGVQVKYDLYILCLLDVAIRSLDGEGNEIVPIISLEPHQYRVGLCAVTPLVQGVARSSGHVWGFIWIVRVFQVVNERVLSWVNVLAHVTGGVAPRAACCWCTARRSASRAASFTLLFTTALANCSSLHVEHTFWIALCVEIPARARHCGLHARSYLHI